MHTHVCLYAHYMFVHHVCAHMCSICTCVCVVGFHMYHVYVSTHVCVCAGHACIHVLVVICV